MKTLKDPSINGKVDSNGRMVIKRKLRIHQKLVAKTGLRVGARARSKMKGRVGIIKNKSKVRSKPRGEDRHTSESEIKTLNGRESYWKNEDPSGDSNSHQAECETEDMNMIKYQNENATKFNADAYLTVCSNPDDHSHIHRPSKRRALRRMPLSVFLRRGSRDRTKRP